MLKLFASFLAFLAIFINVAPVLACDPYPYNPPKPNYINCTDLGSGYRMGFGIVGARNGTYRLSSRDGFLIGGAPEDRRNTIAISGSNGRVFDWRATLGIDAVIINAGGRSTVRKLNEVRSGEDFYGKLEYGYNKRPYKIDRISFCYDYELSISTSSEGTYTSASEWTLLKTVDQPLQSRFAGETAPFEYTVAVDGSAGDATGYKVVTDLSIKNETPIKAVIKKVNGYLPAWKKWIKLDCGEDLPFTLKAGKELTCSATTEVNSERSGESYITVYAYGLEGDRASAKIQWSENGSGSGAPIRSVTVTDTQEAFGGPYTVSAPSSWTYTVDLTCPSDPQVYTDGVYTMTLNNTASIVETNAQASQAVELLCYAPLVSGSGESTGEVTYQWGITKTSPTTNLTLRQDRAEKVDYDVVVSVLERVETNVRLNGTIVVSNPHPAADMSVTLLDANTQNLPAALTDCANPLTIAAGQSVACQYEAAPESQNEPVGDVQVWMNGIVFGSVSPADFGGGAVSEIDECVTVYDSAFDQPLGTACADLAPATFEYQVTVGPFDECFDTDYTNTAYFITNDTGDSDYANWQVLINVLCTTSTNCTYNATYWIAHADPHPDIYDTTWDQIQPGGPNTPFFTTNLTWLGMLSTGSPDSVYDRLAREYIVGRLNVLHGSEATDQFFGTLDHAASLLAEYAAARDAISEVDIVADFNDTHLIIKNYNDGYTGPGVCPDCTTE